MSQTVRIEKLQRSHDVDSFDCSQDALNRFLIRCALQNQQSAASQTYLGLIESEVAGYYTLVVGEVSFDQAPERVKKGLARHPVPIMLLARLAVSASRQGKGLGSGLLQGCDVTDFASRRHRRHPGTCGPRQGCCRESLRRTFDFLASRPAILIICFV